MSISTGLLKVQEELKCAKNQVNSFGGYKYRSCEDILEAVKPLCVKNNIVLTLSDEIIGIGDRIYVKATATIVDTETAEAVQVSAFARESLTKKGMDESQITGTASSYARKYALNGLFCIDDTKDADFLNTGDTVVVQGRATTTSSSGPITAGPTADTGVLTRGQYKGQHVKDIKDYGYLNWLVEKSNFPQEQKDIAAKVLDEAATKAETQQEEF